MEKKIGVIGGQKLCWVEVRVGLAAAVGGSKVSRQRGPHGRGWREMPCLDSDTQMSNVFSIIGRWTF